MSEKTPQEAVAEFHRIFSMTPDPDRPTLREERVRELRASLIEEETIEVVEALREGNLAHIAKELADLIYVTYGTALEYGIDLDACVHEVHRSNLSKLGPDGRPIRREDGKALKGPDYREADMESEIQRQIEE